MSTLSDILPHVREQKTQHESVKALLTGIKYRLADALAGTKLPPDVEARLATVMPDLEANSDAVAEAINANTAAPKPEYLNSKGAASSSQFDRPGTIGASSSNESDANERKPAADVTLQHPPAV